MTSSKAPKTPDYTGAATQQGQNDMQIAQYLTQANRPNQIDPYGQTTWSQGSDPNLGMYQKDLADYQALAAKNPGWDSNQVQAEIARRQGLIDKAQNGQWTQTTTLNPAQQKLLNQTNVNKGLQNSRIEDLLKTFNPNAGDIGNQIYRQMTDRYDDRFAREEEATKSSLLNQGFQQGSEGYNNGLTDFNRTKNDAYGDAATQASIAGYGQYNTEMNFLAQLLGGNSGPTNPTYQPFSQATPYQSPDLLGAMQGQYQGDLNRTNASNASRGQTVGAVGTIATAAAIAF